MKKHKTGQIAIVLTASPVKVLEQNPHRLTIELQNQEALASIFTRWGGDGTPRSYMRYDPSMSRILDLAPTEELWAYSDTAGAILTVMITDGE